MELKRAIRIIEEIIREKQCKLAEANENVYSTNLDTYTSAQSAMYQSANDINSLKKALKILKEELIGRRQFSPNDFDKRQAAADHFGEANNMIRITDIDASLLPAQLAFIFCSPSGRLNENFI